MNKMVIAVIAGIISGFAMYFILSSLLATPKPELVTGNTHLPAYMTKTNAVSEFIGVCKAICGNLNMNETLTQSIYNSYNTMKEINQTLADEIIKLPEDVYCDSMIFNETASNEDCNGDGDKRDVCKCPDLYTCTVLNRIMVCRR